MATKGIARAVVAARRRRGVPSSLPVDGRMTPAP
jgi:hypothetical protein